MSALILAAERSRSRIATSSVTSNAELNALALVGPIFYRRLMAIEPFDPERVDKLIDTVVGVSPMSPRLRSDCQGRRHSAWAAKRLQPL